MKVAAKWRIGWFVSIGISFRVSDVLSSKETLPAATNSKLSETIDGLHAALTKKDSVLRLLQGDEDIELEDICQELLASQGNGCSCIGLSNGNVRLSCPDSYCQWCDEDLETCGIKTYSLELGPNGTPPNYIVGTSSSFEYTSGETVAVFQSSCDVFDGYTNGCSECVAYVNGEECTSCSMCEDRYSYTVDCENLATSSSFSECSGSGPEYGIFEGLGFYTCQYVEPTNDVCSNTTLLQFGLAMIGRTNGATEDSISSSCNLVEGNDVWYSVVGTGDTILVTTCSYETYVGTVIDVFSGRESCEDLDCIDATESLCAAGLNGATVSWSSEAGVLYHLRVVTTDYEDQFKIVVWGVTPSENTACTSSISSNSIDVIGSTLSLSGQLETDICGERGTPGLWYQVTAVDNGVMRASTCSSKTSIGTAVTVMTGSDCDTLTCVKSSSVLDGTIGCTEVGTIVEWNVTTNQTYFVYIRGTDSNGIFGVSIEPLQVPNNDACAEAAVVSPDDGIIQGNIENATQDFIGGAACEQEAYISPRGVWYKVAGSENFLRATICPGSDSFGDYAISVYTGDCSGLVCAAESTYTNCGSMGGRTVSWEALEGVEYYVFVHSQYAPGSFDLVFEEFEPASNIQCTNAEGPLIPVNQTIVASTRNSVPDDVSGCESGFRSAGLWYSVVGQEGLTYRVDTCSNETNFDTEISIYSGSCDGGLECVVRNDDSCGGSTSSVQWKASEGMVYYIKIYGYSGAVGDFEMTLSSFAPPKNDACLGSILLAPIDGETIVVSTIGSTPDVLPGCSSAFSGNPGVWYLLEGNGKLMSISSCSSLTKSGTTISVFINSCEDLSCVNEGILDYSCQDTVGNNVIFLADEGTTYFILLQSSDGYGGDVGLTVKEFEAAENDACLGSVVLSTSNNDTIAVSTASSTPDVIPGCSSTLYNAPGVWYQVEGNGKPISISSCSALTTVGTTAISVFSGSCEDLSCVSEGISDYNCQNTVASRAVFLAEEGMTYFILLQSYDGYGGDVGLTITEFEAAENDACLGSVVLSTSNNETIAVSTASSTPDVIPGCSAALFNAPGVWYQMEGSGKPTSISSCSPLTTVGTAISVFSGSCEELSCVSEGIPDYSCQDAGGTRAIFLAEEGMTYFILLQSYDGYGGDVGLTIAEFEAPQNDACVGSIVLAPNNDETIVAFSVDSTPDVFPSCSYALFNAPGVWYQIEGNGKPISISSCSPSTSIGTTISVFTGSCEDLSCVSEGISDYSCQNTVGTRAIFLAEEGTTYFILLQSYDGYGGDVGLTITEFEAAENDACLGSIVLSPSNDETIVVSTADSTPDVTPGCSFAVSNYPGVWYKMEGSGKPTSISSCSPLTTVSTAISVFSGSCEDLLCVSEGIPNYDCQNTVATRAVFLAEEGNTYFILLQSYDGYEGDVGLTITEFDATENDFCQLSSSVTIDGGEVTGTTIGASGGSNGNECYIDPSIPDVWYFVDGTGDVLQATACSSSLNYISMAILHGNCTELYCIGTASSDSCATVRFQSDVEERYHILIQSSGEYSLSVITSSVEAPANDLCSNAELIEPSRNSTIFGSTTDALQESFDDACSGVSIDRDLWYQVVGNGAMFLASLCNPETDFDSQLSIYAFSDEDGSCSNLECVSTNDDSCGLASQVGWLTEQDRVYLIRVHGLGGSFGNFALTVREEADELSDGGRY